jgi:hypothetical protein
MSEQFDATAMRNFEESLRAAAKSRGWGEPDTSAVGLIDEPIQEHPAGPLDDFELDRLPEHARFVGWAKPRVTDTEVIVEALDDEGDPGLAWDLARRLLGRAPSALPRGPRLAPLYLR